MRRGRALSAEIFLGLNQAAAEIMHPDAVDLNAGCEGIFGIDEPAGEVEASARFLWGKFWRDRVKNIGRQYAYFLVGAQKVATKIDERLAGLFKLLHHH